MKLKPAWLLLGLCVASTGCGLAVNFGRNLVNEPALLTSNLKSCLRNRHLAKAAWDEVSKAAPRPSSSADYARGFKDGFADYLDAGGTGLPPPLPPRCYWRTRNQTPEGHQAIEDWFAGFRHGVAVAQASGYRELVIVPSSLPLPGMPNLDAQPRAGEVSPGAPVESTLPVPRKETTSETSSALVEPSPALPATSAPAEGSQFFKLLRQKGLRR